MNKFEFITELRARLWAIPEEDAVASVEYYGEMIDERMEEGLSEEEAVAAIGDVDEIAQGILAEMPQAAAPVKEKKVHRLRWWEITLLVLGFPVWGSLAVAAGAVIFSVWVSLWAVVISLYATAIALGASGIGCALGSFFMIGSHAEVTVAWGAALVCAGLTILFFMLSNLAAKGLIALTKLIWNGAQVFSAERSRTHEKKNRDRPDCGGSIDRRGRNDIDAGPFLCRQRQPGKQSDPAGSDRQAVL